MQLASPLRELACHMGSHTRVTFPPLYPSRSWPVRFSDRGGVRIHIRTCGILAWDVLRWYGLLCSNVIWQSCHMSEYEYAPLQGHCYAKSSCRSVEPQTLHGNVHQVDHVPNGPTNSAATTTMFPLRLCGGKPLVAVTRERRYGPSRLRVNDDDGARLS